MNIINIILKYKIYFTIVCLIVFALFLMYSGYSNYKEISSFKTWENINNGIKIESKIEEKVQTKKVRSKTSTTIKYIPYIKYSFTYKDKTYQNDKISNIEPSFTNKSDAETFLNDYSENFKVYFNPKNPNESYLTLNTNQVTTLMYLSISTILILVSILLFIFKDSTFVKVLFFL